MASPKSRTSILADEATPSPLQELRKTMWDKVGIVRSRESLEEAQRLLKGFGAVAASMTATDSVDLRATIEMRHAVVAAGLVTDSALKRRESRGTHFRVDYPRQSEEFAKPILVRR